MYKCKKCKGVVEAGIPQAKIFKYRVDGQIRSEKKVCFYCKYKENKK